MKDLALVLADLRREVVASYFRERSESDDDLKGGSSTFNRYSNWHTWRAQSREREHRATNGSRRGVVNGWKNGTTWTSCFLNSSLWLAYNPGHTKVFVWQCMSGCKKSTTIESTGY